MIFIDTGVFISKYIERDQYHVSSVSFWREITETRERLFTSNFVIDETLTLLGRRTSYGFSAERALKIYDSNHLTILRPDRFDELEAIKLF